MDEQPLRPCGFCDHDRDKHDKSSGYDLWPCTHPACGCEDFAVAGTIIDVEVD